MAVSPAWFVAFTSAPTATTARTVSSTRLSGSTFPKSITAIPRRLSSRRMPIPAAIISGVAPSGIVSVRSAPPSARARTISGSRNLAASKYGVDPAEYHGVFDVLLDDDEEFKIGDLTAKAIHLPGHTPDHFAVCAGRGGDQAVFTGDLIHSPIQARYPDLVMRVDYDQKQASATRRAFLERYCDTSTLCCTMHFPSPSVGHIKRWGDGFRCEPTAD